MSDKYELYSQRTKLVEDQRKMLDKAESEKRELSAEEDSQYRAMETDFQKLSRAIEMEEKESFLRTSMHEPTKPMPGGYSQRTVDKKEGEIRFYDPGTHPRVEDIRLNDQDERDMAEFLRYGELRLSRETLGRFQKRSLEASKDASGGYLVSPEQFTQQVIAELINAVFVRKYATVISLKSAASLGVPEMHEDLASSEWVGELNIGSADTSLSFAKRSLTPHPLARYIRCSKTLIRQSPLVVDFIRSRMTGKFATVEENAFLNGTGVNSPLGVMVASASGISTARDCNTGALATGICADHLIETAGTLKAGYAAGARWAFHRTAITKIRRLKDAEGNYLWQPGLIAGQPDMLLGYPVDSSEYMPNTFTTTQYVGILANWKYYWIVDALDMEVQVLTELFAATNENAYVGRKETDAAPVDENGFVRVKLG